MYYFNSWDLAYRRPFGAIKVGDNLKVNFKSDESNTTVKFIIRRDFGKRYEFDMNKIEKDIFSISVDFDVGPGLYFYYFEIDENTEWGQIKHYYGTGDKGGEGVLYANENDVRPYQVTVFGTEDTGPQWYRKSVFYQIFPDRFYNGNENQVINHPKPNSFIYGSLNDEPFYVKDDFGNIARWDFFGGNLKGIIKKIPYLKELGVNALYLNPIFLATSNHRYDTNDYLKIDPMLGTEEDFKTLVECLHSNNMHIILDGVFSHVGKNSRYFNLNGDYGENEGAAKTPESPYFEWFKFRNYPDDYKSWWGIKDLPEIDKENKAFQDFIYGKENSVLSKWNDFNIDGWRLDVADELPDSFIQGIRENLERYPDTILIGEVWEDASNKISYGHRRDYILGGKLQGCMNYPLRETILKFLSLKCSAYDAAHEFMTLYENYPKDVFYNNLNNLGTHDTERIITALGEEAHALAVGMMFSLPGIPCIYYGDEAGVTGDKDPNNRKFFPWQKIQDKTYELYQSWTKKRLSKEALISGEFSVFYTDNVLGILRYTPTDDPKEVSIYMVNPGEEKIVVNFDEIKFLKTCPCESRLAKRMTTVEIPGKTGLDIHMRQEENEAE